MALISLFQTYHNCTICDDVDDDVGDDNDGAAGDDNGAEELLLQQWLSASIL
jgi:hypothetical protein